MTLFVSLLSVMRFKAIFKTSIVKFHEHNYGLLGLNGHWAPPTLRMFQVQFTYLRPTVLPVISFGIRCLPVPSPIFLNYSVPG